ncbi:MAG: DUF4241 domain-containing protein [Sandaracinaceae bacterium]|nr:DUF4241 domain-containing protein [Sandaracinaceae bacterium]
MSEAPEWLRELAEGSLEGVREVGKERLEVTSGRLVACDPLVFLSGADPFAREVPAGRHEVRVGQLDGDNAYAIVRFGKGKIARWEVARCPGEEDVEGWPGYGVDSGTGCFTDYAVVERFRADEEALSARVAAKLSADGVDATDALSYHEAHERAREELGGADPLDALVTDLGRHPIASVVLPGGELVAFKAGAGDGVYASFWGLSARQKVLALVTDFGLLADAPAPADEDDGEDDEDEASPDDELEALEAELGGELGLARELGDLGRLDALAAALGLGAEPEPEEQQGPSPLFLQARDLVKGWVRAEKIELEPDTNLDAFAEALLEKLVSLSGQRRPGAHIAEWLLDRPEVADVYATDEDFDADLVR